MDNEFAAEAERHLRATPAVLTRVVALPNGYSVTLRYSLFLESDPSSGGGVTMDWHPHYPSALDSDEPSEMRAALDAAVRAFQMDVVGNLTIAMTKDGSDEITIIKAA